MTKPRLVLRASVVEDDDRIGVKISVTDEHIAGCAACLMHYALRLSATFLNMVEQLREEVDAEEDARPHALH